VRIATFNVNGINARLAGILRWLEEFQPDIACLQELKAPSERFPEAALRSAGYEAIWHGQKSWNGVAILSRGAAPIERCRALPGDPEDLHSRYIEALVGDVVVGCLYLPNGNPASGPRFEYKLGWFDRLIRHSTELLGERRRTVLAGDFNVIPTDLDVYAPERWRDDALFLPEVRSAYQRLLSQGWIDAIRTLHPDERVYTFWKYLRDAYARDAGLRIDHLLLSPPLASGLVAAGVHREVRARDKPSDHAPVWIEIED
jgi:exodeoxyribonuclease III